MHIPHEGVTDWVTPFVMPFSPQRFTHRRTRVCLGDCIEVAIDIRRGAHIAMSEPFLDLFHWNALRKEHRGAGVAKIVESYLAKSVSFKEHREVLTHVIGIINIAYRIPLSTI